MKITDEGANSLASLTALKDLTLHPCWEITDAGLQRLASLTSLTRRQMEGCREITDVRCLTSLTALKSVIVPEVQFEMDNISQWTTALK